MAEIITPAASSHSNTPSAEMVSDDIVIHDDDVEGEEDSNPESPEEYFDSENDQVLSAKPVIVSKVRLPRVLGTDTKKYAAKAVAGTLGQDEEVGGTRTTRQPPRLTSKRAGPARKASTPRTGRPKYKEISDSEFEESGESEESSSNDDSSPTRSVGPRQKTPAKKAATKKVAKKAATKKAPTKKAPTKKAPTKKAPIQKAPTKAAAKKVTSRLNKAAEAVRDAAKEAPPPRGWPVGGRKARAVSKIPQPELEGELDLPEENDSGSPQPVHTPLQSWKRKARTGRAQPDEDGDDNEDDGGDDGGNDDDRDDGDEEFRPSKRVRISETPQRITRSITRSRSGTPATPQPTPNRERTPKGPPRLRGGAEMGYDDNDYDYEMDVSSPSLSLGSESDLDTPDGIINGDDEDTFELPAPHFPPWPLPDSIAGYASRLSSHLSSLKPFSQADAAKKTTAKKRNPTQYSESESSYSSSGYGGQQAKTQHRPPYDPKASLSPGTPPPEPSSSRAQKHPLDRSPHTEFAPSPSTRFKRPMSQAGRKRQRSPSLSESDLEVWEDYPTTKQAKPRAPPAPDETNPHPSSSRTRSPSVSLSPPPYNIPGQNSHDSSLQQRRRHQNEPPIKPRQQLLYDGHQPIPPSSSPTPVATNKSSQPTANPNRNRNSPSPNRPPMDKELLFLPNDDPHAPPLLRPPFAWRRLAQRTWDPHHSGRRDIIWLSWAWPPPLSTSACLSCMQGEVARWQRVRREGMNVLRALGESGEEAIRAAWAAGWGEELAGDVRGLVVLRREAGRLNAGREWKAAKSRVLANLRRAVGVEEEYLQRLDRLPVMEWEMGERLAVLRRKKIKKHWGYGSRWLEEKAAGLQVDLPDTAILDMFKRQRGRQGRHPDRHPVQIDVPPCRYCVELDKIDWASPNGNTIISGRVGTFTVIPGLRYEAARQQFEEGLGSYRILQVQSVFDQLFGPEEKPARKQRASKKTKYVGVREDWEDGIFLQSKPF